MASPSYAKSCIAGLFGVICLFLQAAPALAQQVPLPPLPPGPPALPGAAGAAAEGELAVPAAPREVFFKLTFAALDQFSYKSHPFFELTDEDLFIGGDAGGGSSFEIGTNDSDQDSNFIEQVVHALPPFGFEFVWNFPFVFPQGIGVGLDYAHFGQTDKEAGDKVPPPTLPRFEMDTFYIAVPVRFYGFDPREPGINYFLGFSLGVVNGNLLTRNTGSNGEDETIGFSESAVGATRAGVEVNGENFGFRYELILINPREVTFDRNPFPPAAGESEAPTTIDMSGSIIRISLHFAFR